MRVALEQARLKRPHTDETAANSNGLPGPKDCTPRLVRLLHSALNGCFTDTSTCTGDGNGLALDTLSIFKHKFGYSACAIGSLSIEAKNR